MLHVERRGAGPPLLLIHGLGGDWQVWEPVLDRLATERTVLAVDLPGFGRSPTLPSETSPTPAALAAAVAAALDELGIDRIDVAGNSLGGWVALELARIGRAERVTAICPAGFWDGPLGPRQGFDPRSLPRALRTLAPVVAALPGIRRLALAGVVAHPERVPPAATRRIVRAYLAAPGFDAANAAMRADHLQLGDLAGFGVPITLAWADRDRLVRPPRGGISGVRVVELTDAGHLPQWDQPALVADLVLAAAEHP